MKPALFIFALTFLFSGCKKLTEFYIEEEIQFYVPASNLHVPQLNLLSPETHTEFEQTLEANDTRFSWTEDARLEDLSLEIVTPTHVDFGFLKSVELFLSAPNEPEVLIAHHYDVPPAAGSTLELTTTGVSLREFLDEERMTLRSVIVTDETVHSEITVEANIRLFVKAKTRIIG